MVKLYNQASANGARALLALLHYIHSTALGMHRGEVANRIFYYLASRSLCEFDLKGYEIAFCVTALHYLPYLAPVYQFVCHCFGFDANKAKSEGVRKDRLSI